MANSRRELLCDVPGILTAGAAPRDRRRDRRDPAPRRQHPVDAGRAHRPVEPRRGGDGPRPRRAPRRGGAGVRVAAAACSTPTARGTPTTSANEVKDPTLDTNVTCYVANGVWHHYLCTGDSAFLEEYWPVVERAIDFALDLPDRDGRDRVAGRRPRRRRAAHRLVEHPPVAALRDRHRRAPRPRAPRLGAVARIARHRARPPARPLPRQAALGDGLVLPDPRRRAARPRRAHARSPRAGRRSWSRAAACAACRTSRGSRPPRRASS